MESKLEKIANFIRASPLQQLASLASAAATTLHVIDSFYGNSAGGSQNGINPLSFLLSGIIITCGELCAFDLYKKYLDVKGVFSRIGWDERVVKNYEDKWCMRHMVKTASDDAGFGDETRNYLGSAGYGRYFGFKSDSL